MKRYNFKILDLDSKAITEASNITLAGMLKVLKSLNRNSLEPQPMKISKKRAYIPKDKYDTSTDQSIAELIKDFD